MTIVAVGYTGLLPFEQLLGSSFDDNERVYGNSPNSDSVSISGSYPIINVTISGSGFIYADGPPYDRPAYEFLPVAGVVNSLSFGYLSGYYDFLGFSQFSVDASDFRAAFQNKDFSLLQNSLFGGDDIIFGGPGYNPLTFYGGSGNDIFYGNSGLSTFFGESGNDFFIGGNGSGRFFGGDGDDYLAGGGSSDTLSGGTGADVLLGGDGSDTLDGGAGADFFDGGNGLDLVSYETATSGVEQSIEFGGGTGDAAGDVLFSIEGLIGSDFDDILSGNHFAGDGLFGGLGSDQLFGFDGNDNLSGGSGDDILLGGAGNDSLFGGEGNDMLSGGTGADYISGDAGVDAVSYRDATSGVALGLGDYFDSTNSSFFGLGSGGEALGDRLFLIENVWGSDFSDEIIGDINNNQLLGFAGNDSLSGGGGNDIVSGGAGRDILLGGAGDDTLFGGDGRDTLTGGIDADLFAYTRWESEGGDTITDFESGVDKMGFSTYWFGIPTPGAVQASEADFVTDGTVFSYRPTFLWNETAGDLRYDPDGLGATGIVSIATFSPGTTLLASDLWVA
ncbi:calcium-binding protein [Sphingobium sp. AN558]|uniref:calcium-binding protein n=1 Tax=Sphingobium sp. AN558 TaxID=3133442 RepID=UPI0030BFF096